MIRSRRVRPFGELRRCCALDGPTRVRRFQEFVASLAKSPTGVRSPRSHGPMYRDLPRGASATAKYRTSDSSAALAEPMATQGGRLHVRLPCAYVIGTVYDAWGDMRNKTTETDQSARPDFGHGLGDWVSGAGAQAFPPGENCRRSLSRDPRGHA